MSEHEMYLEDNLENLDELLNQLGQEGPGLFDVPEAPEVPQPPVALVEQPGIPAQATTSQHPFAITCLFSGNREGLSPQQKIARACKGDLFAAEVNTIGVAAVIVGRVHPWSKERTRGAVPGFMAINLGLLMEDGTIKRGYRLIKQRGEFRVMVPIVYGANVEIHGKVSLDGEVIDLSDREQLLMLPVAATRAREWERDVYYPAVKAHANAKIAEEGK